MSVYRAIFRNSRGMKLAGKFHIPEEPTDRIIILAHGFCGDKNEHGSFLKVSEALNEAGISTLRFDFSGSVESDPTDITIGKQVDDLRAAIAFSKGKGYTSIGLFGHSLGGLCSLLVYSQDIRSIVTHGSPTKPMMPAGLETEKAKRDFATKGFTVVENDSGDRFRVSAEFIKEISSIDQSQVIRSVRCPLLLIHGSSDSRVPPEHAVGVKHILNTESQVQIIPGMDHDMIDSLEKTIALTVEWFKKHL